MYVGMVKVPHPPISKAPQSEAKTTSRLDPPDSGEGRDEFVSVFDVSVEVLSILIPT